MVDINNPETWVIWSFDVSGTSEYVEGTALTTYGETTFAIAHTRDYVSGEYDLDSTIMIYWHTDINAVEAEGVQGVFWIYEDVTQGNLTDFDTHCKRHNHNIKLDEVNPGKDLTFLYDKFGNTHEFKKVYMHQGFVIVYPK